MRKVLNFAGRLPAPEGTGGAVAEVEMGLEQTEQQERALALRTRRGELAPAEIAKMRKQGACGERLGGMNPTPQKPNCEAAPAP